MTQTIWVILGALAVPVVLLLATTGCGLQSAGVPPKPGDGPPPDGDGPRTPPYAQIVLDTPGLAGYWRLGEPSGATQALDSSPGAYDGDYVGDITLGQSGALNYDTDTAALFAGTETGGYVEVLDMPSLAGGEVTVELWALPPDTAPDWGLLVGCYEPIISEPDTTIAKGFRLRVKTEVGQIHIEANLGGMGSPLTAQKQMGDAPVWHHVVLTYPNASGQAELYIDGQQLSEPMTGPFNVETTQSPPPTLRFGAGYSLFEPNVTYPYPGWLDEVALYQTWLPQEEVEKHYNAALP